MSSSTAQNNNVSEYQLNLEILRQIPYFSGLKLDCLKVLAYLCERHTYKEGEMVFEQADTDHNAYYVIEGQAQVSRDGKNTTTKFKDGDFIGILSLMGDISRHYGLKATSELEVMILSQEKFQKTLERFPEMAHVVMNAVAKAISTWEEHHILPKRDEIEAYNVKTGISLL